MREAFKDLILILVVLLLGALMVLFFDYIGW